ncbi:MAG TPA: RQC-minor-1 family DNA-binding protein [Longimicrobium sp.]|nr:RQC-minor-1 family DNA-binding protein [Longimicrobium sp.]
MSRRVQRVPVHLDARGVGRLPFDDLKAILRAADPLIARGGRTLLAAVLRGSRRKEVLEHGLDRVPVHGYFRGIPEAEVLKRIDRAIVDGYLDIHYDYRLPLLVYTPKGWEIEKETYARELFDGFEARLRAGPPYGMETLKDRDRGMILRVLELVEESGDALYIPLLEEWAACDYRKVRERIGQVIRRLSRPPADALGEELIPVLKVLQ